MFKKLLIGFLIVLYATSLFAKPLRQDDPSYQVDHNRTKNFSPTYHYLQEQIEQVGPLFSGISGDTFTINNDLQDITSKLIFGRTTGGNAEISYAGVSIGFNKDIVISGPLTGRGYSVLEDYASFGVTGTNASTILGNNIKASSVNGGYVNKHASAGDPGQYIKLNWAAGITFHTNVTGALGSETTEASNEKARINLDGVWLINATAPIGTEKLRVNGSIYTDVGISIGGTYSTLSLLTDSGTNFRFTNRSADNRLSLDNIGTSAEMISFHSSSAVSINTTSVIGTEKLRVNGDVYLDGSLRLLGYGKVKSGQKALSDGSATGLFEVAIPSNTSAGGTVHYSIKCFDGTDLQDHSGTITFAGVNKGGTVTSDIDEVYLAASETLVTTAGTLNDTWSITNGAGKITINLNANTSLTPTSFIVNYTIMLNGNEAITQL